LEARVQTSQIQEEKYYQPGGAPRASCASCASCVLFMSRRVARYDHVFSRAPRLRAVSPRLLQRHFDGNLGETSSRLHVRHRSRQYQMPGRLRRGCSSFKADGRRLRREPEAETVPERRNRAVSVLQFRQHRGISLRSPSMCGMRGDILLDVSGTGSPWICV
jgi:hypothetical protein